MLDEWLSAKLDQRAEKDMLRRLTRSDGLVDFTSNDYLGLARSQAIAEEISGRLRLLPPRNGSTGSRLLSGNSEQIELLEKKLSVIFESESTLLFNSGYTANLAILSALPQKDDTIICDELAHASIKDGARLSLARKLKFKHNDLNDLQSKMSRCAGRIFIVVESVYSMDGDESPLAALVALAERAGAVLIVDEAHSTGTTGPLGAGMCVQHALHKKAEVRIYTFGKAIGASGACVAGSKKLIDFLVNFARPFIYTTAPTPHDVAAVDCAFDYLSSNISLQDTLRKKVSLFTHLCGSMTSRIPSTSAIQTFVVPGNTQVKKVSSELRRKGFDVRPILAPTVPAGTERIRICLHTFNTDEEIRELARELSSLAIAE